jgi:hypothetical protein
MLTIASNQSLNEPLTQGTSKSRALLETVQGILTDYRAYLRLTIRQVFYRLVGVYGYPKKERAYKNLCELLNRARRGGVQRYSG